jgi:hypothetical protein
MRSPLSDGVARPAVRNVPPLCVPWKSRNPMRPAGCRGRRTVLQRVGKDVAFDPVAERDHEAIAKPCAPCCRRMRIRKPWPAGELPAAPDTSKAPEQLVVE